MDLKIGTRCSDPKPVLGSSLLSLILSADVTCIVVCMSQVWICHVTSHTGFWGRFSWQKSVATRPAVDKKRAKTGAMGAANRAADENGVILVGWSGGVGAALPLEISTPIEYTYCKRGRVWLSGNVCF